MCHQHDSRVRPFEEGVAQTLHFLICFPLGLMAFSAALIYTLHNREILQDSRELTSGHFGYCFILAWVCVPLLLCSGVIYIQLRKKEWPQNLLKYVNNSIGTQQHQLFVSQNCLQCHVTSCYSMLLLRLQLKWWYFCFVNTCLTEDFCNVRGKLWILNCSKNAQFVV